MQSKGIQQMSADNTFISKSTLTETKPFCHKPLKKNRIADSALLQHTKFNKAHPLNMSVMSRHLSGMDILPVTHWQIFDLVLKQRPQKRHRV